MSALTSPLDLYDPRNGDLAFRIEPLHWSEESEPPRSNCFRVHWIQSGSGEFRADFSSYSFTTNDLLFLVPYQLSRVVPAAEARGLTLLFHANFFCIETHHEEVGCNGVLFNDLYGLPLVHLAPDDVTEVTRLFAGMGRELREAGLAHAEILVSYLKILLVYATRLKLQQQHLAPTDSRRMPEVIPQLQGLIEANFRQEHSPSFYAARLALAPKSLAHLVKQHLRKTPTSLIRERLMKQAKWELLHTRKPIKQIAAELGFLDTYYFSRLFKQVTGCSPAFFRNFETEIRGGRNLSIL